MAVQRPSPAWILVWLVIMWVPCLLVLALPTLLAVDFLTWAGQAFAGGLLSPLFDLVVDLIDFAYVPLGFLLSIQVVGWWRKREARRTDAATTVIVSPAVTSAPAPSHPAPASAKLPPVPFSSPTPAHHSTLAAAKPETPASAATSVPAWIMLAVMWLHTFVHAVLVGGILSCIFSYCLKPQPGGDAIFVYAFGHYLLAALAAWSLLVIWKCRRNWKEAGLFAFSLWLILVVAVGLLIAITLGSLIILALVGVALPSYKPAIDRLEQPGVPLATCVIVALLLACAWLFWMGTTPARKSAEKPAKK